LVQKRCCFSLHCGQQVSKLDDIDPARELASKDAILAFNSSTSRENIGLNFVTLMLSKSVFNSCSKLHSFDNDLTPSCFCLRSWWESFLTFGEFENAFRCGEAYALQFTQPIVEIELLLLAISLKAIDACF